MADYIKRIRTESGDLQIDYAALANLPQSDTTLTKSGSFADAKIVGNKIKELNEDIQEMNAGVTETSSKVDQLAEALENFGADVEEQGYVTETQLIEKGYVTETKLAEQGYVTGSELASLGYVTETELDEKGYLTEMPVATTSTYGAVKPSSNNFYFDENGYMRAHRDTLDGLGNVIVSSSAPSNPIEGFWYLIPWGGDG